MFWFINGSNSNNYNKLGESAPIIKVNKNEICRKPSETKYERARQKRLKLLENCNLALAKEKGWLIKNSYIVDSFSPENSFWMERTSNSINNQIITGNIIYKSNVKKYDNFKKCFEPRKLNDNYYN